MNLKGVQEDLKLLLLDHSEKMKELNRKLIAGVFDLYLNDKISLDIFCPTINSIKHLQSYLSFQDD